MTDEVTEGAEVDVAASQGDKDLKLPSDAMSAQEQAETLDMIEEAGKAAERLEKANKELQELINQQEKLIMLKRLGGRGEAGMPPKELSKDDKEKADAMRWLEGTGFEEMLDDE